jgi:pullulanase
VIKFDGTHLVPSDPGGETATRISSEPALDHLSPNNQIVIYELPTARTRISSAGGVERGVGSFQDVLALIEPSAEGSNFHGS